MKQLPLIAIFTFLNVLAFAAPVNTAIKNDGLWSSSNTWSLNRVPSNGDTIVIPAKIKVIINSSESLNNVFIKVQGSLQFKNAIWLALDQASTIAVYDNASIDATSFLFQWITLGSNAIFYGSDITGPKYANASTGTNFMTFNNVTIPGGNTYLPVKFTAFNAYKKTNSVMVQWSIANEADVKGYEIERSADGKDWKSVGFVAATNSNSASSYSYTDKSITTGTFYYHVKQVDNTGDITYSTIKVLTTQAQATASSEVKIIAAQNRIMVQFPQEVKGKVAVRFVSPAGQVVDQQVLNAPYGQVVLNQNTSLRGNYFISVSNGQDVNVTSQVIL